METENKTSDVKKFLTFGAIWLFCGVINSIILSILTDVSGTIPMFIKFLLPALGLMISVRVIGIGLLFKFLRKLIFGKKAVITQEEAAKRHKHVIPFTAVLFILGGLISSLWSDNFSSTMLSFTIVGVLWGYLWFVMLDKKYVALDDLLDDE